MDRNDQVESGISGQPIDPKGELSFFFDNELINSDSLEETFLNYADFLMNNVSLDIAGNRYRITECEVYYHCPKTHPDPYVHKRPNQLEKGKWYFNDAGLDITFGEKEKGIFASYLIRGISPLDSMGIYVNGPLNVLREIFNQLGQVHSNNNSIKLSLLPQKISKIKPIRVKRIGLFEKENDTLNFIEKPYRFIVDIVPEHKFKAKENALRELIAKGELTIGHARHALGYEFNG